MEEGVGDTSANSSLSGLSLGGEGSLVSCWGVPGLKVHCGPWKHKEGTGPGLQLSCQHSCRHSLVSGHVDTSNFRGGSVAVGRACFPFTGPEIGDTMTLSSWWVCVQFGLGKLQGPPYCMDDVIVLKSR